MDWEAFYNRFRQPDFIPGYEIQNRLGGGAFGEVYKARKASIGKAYAIKFLKIDDDSQRDAALRELEQVRHFAAIDHPNLVTIEDLGTVHDVPYLIMGYAGEETLSKLMKRGRIEPETALAYFVQTCRGVLALHDRRLVHFDLKPSNVFIKGDVARVGDYGLSKMMTEGRMTLSFGRGTPQYMAPEMLKNRADQRADIYSLGVMLYECIAGALPFESHVAGALPLRDDDTPPQFPEHFPSTLRPVVERCLRLDPAARYDSVAEMLAELGQTARPGESIRVEMPRMPSGAAFGAGGPGSSTATSPFAAGTPGTSEARSAAAELTRGAVEVARGVWDGLRNVNGRSTPRPSTPGTPATPASSAHSATDADAPRDRGVPPAIPDLAPATRGGPPGPIESSTSAGSGDAEVRRETAPVGMQTLSEALRERDQSPEFDADRAGNGSAPLAPAALFAAVSAGHALGPLGGAHHFGASGASVRGAGLAASTIPVPPAVEGGVLPVLSATLALSFEVLFSLVRGAGQRILGGWSRARRTSETGSRFLRGVRRTARLTVFLLVLMVLGALVSYAFFALVRPGDL